MSTGTWRIGWCGKPTFGVRSTVTLYYLKIMEVEKGKEYFKVQGDCDLFPPPSGLQLLRKNQSQRKRREVRSSQRGEGKEWSHLVIRTGIYFLTEPAPPPYEEGLPDRGVPEAHRPQWVNARAGITSPRP